MPGFNLFTEIPRGLAQWDTGTGKTVLAAGVTKAMQRVGRSHPVDRQGRLGREQPSRPRTAGRRGSHQAARLPALRKDGTSKREQQYAEIAIAMEAGACPVVVTNYEKLKFDQDYYKALVTNRKVWVVMDEPSEKLRHRDSGYLQSHL